MKKNEIIERFNIKEEIKSVKRMETTEILVETKVLKEIERKLRTAATTIIKNRFWKKFEKQDTIED